MTIPATHECRECGRGYHLNWAEGRALKIMCERGVCLLCVLWHRTVELHDPGDPTQAIIEGMTYVIGEENTRQTPRGMAGRRFVIIFHDGRRVVTTNLYAGGEIPERHRAALPDNARFGGGAGMVRVGETRCLNPSDPDLPD